MNHDLKTDSDPPLREQQEQEAIRAALGAEPFASAFAARLALSLAEAVTMARSDKV